MYLTYNQLGFIIAAVFMAGCSMGCLAMCMFQAAGRIGEDEMPEPGSYGVDQDGEQTYYPGHHIDEPRWVTNNRMDPDAWKHSNGVKVPHADASAATFHRAE